MRGREEVKDDETFGCPGRANCCCCCHLVGKDFMKAIVVVAAAADADAREIQSSHDDDDCQTGKFMRGQSTTKNHISLHKEFILHHTELYKN